MKFVLFYHSLVSDWNHGNAHFLRGVVRELMRRGHEVRVYEPRGGWSRANLVATQGEKTLADFARFFPGLTSALYDLPTFDLDQVLGKADVVLVHEWSEPELVARIGEYRKRSGKFLLFFHDTHHRMVGELNAITGYDLDGYDGVLAFGEVLRERYLRAGWAQRAWTWHEAADVDLFRPLPGLRRAGDLVWIGNWGDDERSGELQEFLLNPIRRLNLQAEIYGVRYPEPAVAAVQATGARYCGWLANHRVPEVFARFPLTVHVPRRPYVDSLPGIPTIRVFEALACGIPLICSPWRDAEGLFTPGLDFLLAPDGTMMRRLIRDVLHDQELAAALAEHGRQTILGRHTCSHRVEELLAICRSLGQEQSHSVREGAR